MKTTANYLLIAYVDGEQYHFEYEDCGDMWEALEEFWHEDWEPEFARLKEQCFAVDVLATDEGKVIKRYEVAFEMSYFHHFFDHGHITLNEFSKAILKIREDLDAQKPDKKNDNVQCSTPKGSRTGSENEVAMVNVQYKNDVTSFFYYMWNKWSEEECKEVFKSDYYPHFWSKWCEAYDAMHGPRGAAELFYMMLSDTNRNKLVARALEVYAPQVKSEE